MTTLDLVEYYENLLIIQYFNQSNAEETIGASVAPIIMPQTSIQQISFANTPASGTFKLNYDGVDTAAINWNDSVGTIQTKLQAISGLGSVTVVGSIASLSLTVTFTNVAPPAVLLTIDANSLHDAGSNLVVPTVNELDVILPLAIQNAFALGSAGGVQLDLLAKYVGVSRNVSTKDGPISLTDNELTTLIRMAILINTSDYTLSSIQSFLATFFPGQILVFDYKNMQMSYMIDSSLGDRNLALAISEEGLLPRPMGVQLASTIFADGITRFFGFVTYTIPTQHNNEPFNDYSSYQTDWPWLSYSDAL